MPFPPTACCLPLPRSTESDVKHAHREIMNHQRLLHPHVVQLKEVRAVLLAAGCLHRRELQLGLGLLSQAAALGLPLWREEGKMLLCHLLAVDVPGRPHTTPADSLMACRFPIRRILPLHPVARLLTAHSSVLDGTPLSPNPQVFSAKPFLALVMEFVPNGDMFQV